jgi:hypothetical protein
VDCGLLGCDVVLVVTNVSAKDEKCQYNCRPVCALYNVASRVLLEKLIVTQMAKKFPDFMKPGGSLP